MSPPADPPTGKSGAGVGMRRAIEKLDRLDQHGEPAPFELGAREQASHSAAGIWYREHHKARFVRSARHQAAADLCRILPVCTKRMPLRDRINRELLQPVPW